MWTKIHWNSHVYHFCPTYIEANKYFVIFQVLELGNHGVIWHFQLKSTVTYIYIICMLLLQISIWTFPYFMRATCMDTFAQFWPTDRPNHKPWLWLIDHSQQLNLEFGRSPTLMPEWKTAPWLLERRHKQFSKM